jgi:hypothetical protein
MILVYRKACSFQMVRNAHEHYVYKVASLSGRYDGKFGLILRFEAHRAVNIKRWCSGLWCYVVWEVSSCMAVVTVCQTTSITSHEFVIWMV